MKKLVYLLVVTLVLGLVLTGCSVLSDISQVPATGQKYNENNPNPYTFEVGDLVAGQTEIVGGVEVSNDTEYLYVTYMVDDPWCLTETHLAVANLLVEIPQTNKGNPIPGKFPYSGIHNPAVTEFTYEIPLAKLGTNPFIAAHAKVEKIDNGVIQEEAAWGEGTRFVDKGNWGMYFEYEVTVNETPLAVGDSYGGGIVAYILADGDTGYDANVQHGLIAATADATSRMAWSNITSTKVGTTGTAIGTGQANTTAIVGQGGCESGAAYYCDNLEEGGHDDWFLPSLDELYKLYINKGEIGGFHYYYYWSSSEANAGNAWAQLFTSDRSDRKSKDTPYRYVRAVRAF